MDKKNEAIEKQQKALKDLQLLWEKVLGGTVSTKRFKEVTGETVYLGGKRDYCKYPRKAIKTLHGNHRVPDKIASHVNSMYDKWKENRA